MSEDALHGLDEKAGIGRRLVPLPEAAALRAKAEL